MDGNMRRLPPWMLAGASSGVAATSNRADNKSVEGKRKQEPEEAPKTKTEKRSRRNVKPKERDDSEEPKKVGIKRRGGERVGNKIGEEAKPSNSIGGDKNLEIIPEDDLTVDDLLSFAQEYVKGEDDQTRKERESLSISESMVGLDESNTRSSQGGTEEPNGTRDPRTEDMLDLLLGPFFKKPHQ